MSLGTHIYLSSPCPVFFSLFVKAVVLTNLSHVKVPQETLRLYSIWNGDYLQVKMLVWCSVLQRLKNKIIIFFVLLIVVWELRLGFIPKKKKKRRKIHDISSFLCFPVAAWSTFLCLPHILMWKILLIIHIFSICKLKIEISEHTSLHQLFLVNRRAGG